MFCFEQRNSFFSFLVSFTTTEFLLSSCQHILYKFIIKTNRDSAKESKGRTSNRMRFTGGLEGGSQNSQVSARITDDSFSYEKIRPIGVVQILWVIFTMFEFYLKLQKMNYTEKSAQIGFGRQYFFRVIKTWVWRHIYNKKTFYD